MLTPDYIEFCALDNGQAIYNFVLQLFERKIICY